MNTPSPASRVPPPPGSGALYIPAPVRRHWLAGALLLSLALHAAMALLIALRTPHAPPPSPMLVTFMPGAPSRAQAPERAAAYSDANRQAGAEEEKSTGLPLPKTPPPPPPPPETAPPQPAASHVSPLARQRVEGRQQVITAQTSPQKPVPEPSASPVAPVPPPPRTLDLTPSLDEITQWDRSNHGEELRSQREGGEATVNINTRELRYANYMQGVKNLVESVWRYPDQAKREKITGTLLMRFTIDRDGNLVGIEMLRSSGEPLLDHAAIEAVRKSSPYAPLPDSWGVTRLHIHATFEYVLRNFRWAK